MRVYIIMHLDSTEICDPRNFTLKNFFTDHLEEGSFKRLDPGLGMLPVQMSIQ